tara:strand:+ start:41 stop:928 length:888 start_codon:yes stop_codon:yes gene_type:complete
MNSILLRFFILVFFYVFLLHKDKRTDSFITLLNNLINTPVCYFKKLLNKKDDNIEKFTHINIDKTFVINMKKDINRMVKLKKDAKKADLNIKRYDAVNGRKLSLEDLKKNKIVKIEKYSFYNHNKDGRDSLMGSIGCALSHQNIWKKLINSKNNTYMILEDDVIIPENFWLLFDNATSQIKGNWDIIFCGGSRIMGKKVGKNLIKAVFNGNLWKNCGLFGYVINKKAAKKMVKLTTPIDNYIDIQLNQNYNKLKVFYLDPQVIKHNYDFKSSRLNDDTYFYSKNFIKNAEKAILI